MTFWYRLCWWICRIGLFFWHPILRIHGQELVPAGCALLCANHSGMADPIWIMLALNSPKMIRILAKEELRHVPFLGWVMEKFDIIFVRRGTHQPEVYEKSTEALRAGDKLLVFVEGTRCNGDKHVRAKTGAVHMALESGAPVRTVRVAADDQISITSMENDALRRKLESLAIETMTPIEAMNALFELKKML